MKIGGPNRAFVAVTGTYKKLFGLTQAGVPVAEAYAAKLYHDELDADRSLTMNQAGAKFANWVANKPWTDEQKQAVRDTYGKFGVYMFGNTEKYDAFASISDISSDTALRITENIDALEPEDGYTSVRAIQKWEAIVSMSELSEEQRSECIKQYMSTENQVATLNACLNAGLTTEQFVDIMRTKDSYGDANGSWTQDELKSYLNSKSYTRAQKAAIWEAFGSKWKENPYK